MQPLTTNEPMKQAIVPLLSERCDRLLLFFFPTIIMSNITKHRTPNWERFESPPNPSGYPVYQHNGTNYRLIPESELKKMRADEGSAFWLTIGAGITTIGAGIVIGTWISSRPATAIQPTIIEKPVIVEREKLVPTNCLLFCGR